MSSSIIYDNYFRFINTLIDLIENSKAKEEKMEYFIIIESDLLGILFQKNIYSVNVNNGGQVII